MGNSVALLLQLASTLVLGVQHHPQWPMDVKVKALAEAGQVIELSTQALAKVDYPQTPSNSIWPNYDRLLGSLYLDSHGARVPLGPTVMLKGEYLSFGDMNSDGLDDAMVVVMRTDDAGAQSYALAAMVNQGGILFNVGDLPLGNNLTVYDNHRVQSEEFTIDMQADKAPRKTHHYVLWGDELVAM